MVGRAVPARRGGRGATRPTGGESSIRLFPHLKANGKRLNGAKPSGTLVERILSAVGVPEHEKERKMGKLHPDLRPVSGADMV